jgi:hypothetical protein
MLVDISRLCFKWVGLVVTVQRKDEDNEVIFCHTIVALMKVCATVKLSTLIPNSWQHLSATHLPTHPKFMATSWGDPLPSHPTFSWHHLGATHFHLIPHSHGKILGQPTSISSHILMAISWGNPLPSPKEKQMKWMFMYYGKGWYGQCSTSETS